MDTSTLAGALVLASQHPTPDLLWAPVAGRPLLAWSLAACAQTPAIAEIVLIVPTDQVAQAQALTGAEPGTRVQVIPGAARIRDSVEAGLRALDPSLVWVVIHDAGRPLATSELIVAALALAQRADTDVITGEPVKETVKRLRNGLVMETLPRERLARAQIPHVFRRERLLAAHATLPAERDFLDEATLALAAGLPLRVTPGASDNLRVVTTADLAVAAALLANRTCES